MTHFHEMAPYGGLFFSGLALAGAGVMTIRNARKHYAQDMKAYNSGAAGDDIGRPTYWGSLKKGLLEWNYVFEPEEAGNSL
jgi:hypothetical protein